jgi:hypothetical protein
MPILGPRSFDLFGLGMSGTDMSAQGRCNLKVTLEGHHYHSSSSSDLYSSSSTEQLQCVTMRSASRTWTTRQALSLLAPLSAIFLANKILQTRLMLPKDVRQLHENITVSWSQGQLAIDLFAPLSHVTGAKPWVNTARLWIWPLFAVIWIGHFAATPWLSRSRFCWLLLLITTAVAIVSFQGMNRSSANDDVLLSCNGLSDGVLFIALTLTASVRRPGRYLWYGLHAGLADALIWTSIGLGGNLVDFSLLIVDRSLIKTEV